MIKMASFSDLGYYIEQVLKENNIVLNLILIKLYEGGYINVYRRIKNIK